MATNSELVLTTPLVGTPQPNFWTLKTVPMPTITDGHVLTKALYVSVDPYLRGRPSPVGSVIESGQVAEVIESKSNEFKQGDLVFGYLPWRLYNSVHEKTPQFRKVPPASVLPPSTALGILGMPGMTAYTGLTYVNEAKSGETLLVSGAAGAVGSAVGQIAKIKGLKVIGVAGGKEKCDYILNECGFDAAIDYRIYDTKQKISEQLRLLAPQGIDCYFDNTGGHVTDAVWDHLNKFGRVAVCGQISVYNETDLPKVDLFLHKTIYKSITIKGFVVSDFGSKAGEFGQAMGGWVKSGQVKYRETIVKGFDQIPTAFVGLFKGENIGKMVIQI